MERLADYIEKAFEGVPDTDGTLYRYQRQLLEKMYARADELTHVGLRDEKVLFDLVLDEYPDLHADYEKFAQADRKSRRARRFRMGLAFGSIGYTLLLTSLYLIVSFATRRWDMTWLMMEGGMSALAIVLLSFAIRKLCSMRRLFLPIARVLMLFCIMLVAVFAFLLCLMLGVPQSWVIVLGGVVCLFIADASFAAKTKQKLAVINYFLYIPGAAAILYVILAALGAVSWENGWHMIIGGVLIDAVIAIGIAIDNMKYHYKQEVEAAWSEN